MTHTEQERSQDKFKDAGSARGENTQNDTDPAQVLKAMTTHPFTVHGNHLD